MESKTFKYKHSPCFNYSLKDVSKFKKRIKNEFYSYIICQEEISRENINKTIEDEKERLYYFKYAKYLQQEFNSTMVNMIISYINRINSFPEMNKKEINFNYKISNLIKHLLMNEIEVACFNYYWRKQDFHIKIWTNSFILPLQAFYQKKHVEEIMMFYYYQIYFLEIIQNLWKSIQFLNDKDLISKLNENKLNLKQINERFILLSKPKNTYCKINYINIQGIIDQIVKTAQPYFKSKINDVRQKKIVF